MEATIPDELAMELRPKQLNKNQRVLKSMYSDPRDVFSIDDLLRKYYLDHGEVVKRQAMIQQLYLLKRKNMVNRQSVGLYSLTEVGTKFIEAQIAIVDAANQG